MGGKGREGRCQHEQRERHATQELPDMKKECEGMRET